MVKKLSSVILMLCSSVAMAHPGHGMSDNTWHTVSHLAFWLLMLAVVYKAYQWWRQKTKQTSANK
tara:strand:+ start:209 stop:403 length:195 start_codon:yes stop_codon:yes gene_type:complete